MIVAAGGAAGLALGLGILVLTSPPVAPSAPMNAPGLSVNGRHQAAPTTVVYRRVPAAAPQGPAGSNDAGSPGPRRLTLTTEP